MRRAAVWAVSAVLVFAACSSSSSGSKHSTSTSVSTAPSTTLSSGEVTTIVPTVTARSTSTTQPATTTTVPCPDSTRSTAPFTTPPASTAASVLRSVKVTGERCGDLVLFGFRPDHGAPPICNVAYKSGPFSEDASDKPVTVAGTAFVVVRCEPARSYDPETGETTYKAPEHIVPVGTHHVLDVAKTGDFEGVMSWVIGLDGQRPFHAAATDGGTLVISIF